MPILYTYLMQELLTQLSNLHRYIGDIAVAVF